MRLRSPRRRQDGHDDIVFGIDFLMDVKCDFGWVSWGVLGASWGVLGSSLGTSWDVLRRLGRIFFGLRCDFGWFWMDFYRLLNRCWLDVWACCD